MEKIIGEEVPSDIAKILIESGFDTNLSLQNIVPETINDIEEYMNENPIILKETSYQDVKTFKFKPGHKRFILNLPKKISGLLEITEKEDFICSDFSFVLQNLIETAKQNFSRHPKGFRYSEVIRQFSTFIYLQCGKACYEALSANLPIPQANTICKLFNLYVCSIQFKTSTIRKFAVGYISQNETKIIEGDLRCKELNNYLEILKLKKYVWLSEDATGITSKVEFDSKSNQMVGLVLPISTSSGMPIPFSYLARNAEEIQTNIAKDKSTHVYVVMAQPLMAGVPPFMLQIYGTNNKFKTQDVLRRWKRTVEELRK